MRQVIPQALTQKSLDDPVGLWKADQGIAASVPPPRAGSRFCIGSVLHVDPGVDGTYAFGEGPLLRASRYVDWSILRDVPDGHFDVRRPVRLCDPAESGLRYGMPTVRASARSMQDLNCIPDGVADMAVRTGGGNARALSALVLASLTMTAYACHSTMDVPAAPAAKESSDRNRRRGKGNRERKPGVVRDAAAARVPLFPSWAKAANEVAPPELLDAGVGGRFPRGYLSYPADRLEEIFLSATTASPDGEVFVCPHCLSVVPAETLEHDAEVLQCRRLTDRSFTSLCPVCRQTQHWWDADISPAFYRRSFPPEFESRFVADVAAGLPLKLPEQATYAGHKEYSPARDGRYLPDAEARRARPTVHKFVSGADGRTFFFYLPAFARVEAKEGQELAAGEQWATVLPGGPPEFWKARDAYGRWLGLEDVFGNHGGRKYVGLCQMTWFAHQALRTREAPGQVFLPADLVARSTAVKPVALFWDLAECERRLVPELDAVILPPLAMDHWFDFRFGVDGVDLDAGVGDFRFTTDRRRPQVPTTVREVELAVERLLDPDKATLVLDYFPPEEVRSRLYPSRDVSYGRQVSIARSLVAEAERMSREDEVEYSASPKLIITPAVNGNVAGVETNVPRPRKPVTPLEKAAAMVKLEPDTPEKPPVDYDAEQPPEAAEPEGKGVRSMFQVARRAFAAALGG